MSALVASGWFAAGIVMLIAGAELIVRGGSRLAALMNIPPIVVGLTIVAAGTSAPELAVGIEAALRGNGSLAVGNIAGANVINILLVLGLSALILPLGLEIRTVRFDLPVMVVAAILMFAMASDGVMTRGEGAILIFAGIAYTATIVRWSRNESQAVLAEFAEEYVVPPSQHLTRKAAWSLALLVSGIAVVVVGSELLVDGAVGLARLFGVSEAVIGLTIISIGTTTPELFTTLISTLRKDRDIAIGNLLGSSVYNILFILGVICLVPSSGVAVEDDLIRVGIPMMVIVAIVCVPVFISGRHVTRLEGGLFVGAYVAYLSYLVFVHT